MLRFLAATTLVALTLACKPSEPGDGVGQGRVNEMSRLSLERTVDGGVIDDAAA